jgi:hypothetical protein
MAGVRRFRAISVPVLLEDGSNASILSVASALKYQGHPRYKDCPMFAKTF